jgi:Flp pilus assembly secretin CpaC
MSGGAVNWFTFDPAIQWYRHLLSIATGVSMRIARLWACVLGLALFSTLSFARASSDSITLGVGSGSTLTLERPFDTILIGNPNVVDVEQENDRSVILKGLNTGASNIVFLDEQSVVIANVRVVVTDART